MKRADNIRAEQEVTRRFDATAVYHFGDLHRENPSAGLQMDDDTKELPLISGRFAGREWKVEELRREEQERARRRVPLLQRPWLRFGATALAGAALSFALLTASLTGQAELTGLNDQAVAAAAEIQTLREENDRLRTQHAQLYDMSAAEEYAVETLGMQRARQEQVTYLSERSQDRATVLGVRRGQGFNYFCHQVIDTLGAYLQG